MDTLVEHHVSHNQVDVFSAGPSGDGWLVSEWLACLVRDYRIAGRSIKSTVAAPPPTIYEPVTTLTFAIEAYLEGENAVDPHEFGRAIVKLWGGAGSERDGTGYFDVNWPADHQT